MSSSGEVAETLRGSPLLTTGNTVTIVARAGQRNQLAAAITTAKGQRSPHPAHSAIDLPSHWTLGADGAGLLLASTPAATQGL